MLFFTISLVLNMIFTLTLKELLLKREKCKKYLRRWLKKCMAGYIFRKEELPIFVGYGQLDYYRSTKLIVTKSLN